MLYVIIYYTLVIELFLVPVLYFIVKQQMAIKRLTKADIENNVIKGLLNCHYDNLPSYTAMVTEARKRNFSSEFYDSLIAIYFQ